MIIKLMDLMLLLDSTIYSRRGPYDERLAVIMSTYNLSTDEVNRIRSADMVRGSVVL